MGQFNHINVIKMHGLVIEKEPVKMLSFLGLQYSETCIKRPRLGQKKWSLNGGGLLIEVKMHGKAHHQVVFE